MMNLASYIRPATPDDRDQILSMVRDAFSGPERDGSEEVGIVVDTWASDAAPRGCELVAVDGGIVGHVLGAPGDLSGHDVLAVAPLAVAASHRRRGIGSALMAELLRRAEVAGWPLVVLLGNPQYYSRFGFEASGPLGIVYPPVGPDNPHFQARRLSSYDDSYAGEFRYCWENR